MNRFTPANYSQQIMIKYFLSVFIGIFPPLTGAVGSCRGDPVDAVLSKFEHSNFSAVCIFVDNYFQPRQRSFLTVVLQLDS